MSWKPPLRFEEELKRLFVPPDLYIRHLYRKQMNRGEAEYRMLPFLANRARVSLDVGAHKGAFAYALIKHSRAVHAFEPNPKMFDVLQSWAKDRITLHPLALSDRTGEADLRVPRRGQGYSNQGSSLSAIKVHGDHGVVRVQTRRLDDCGIEDVGFIKIDVEGFEHQVLDGAREVLRRDRPNLLVEMEERHTQVPLAEMIAAVCAHGYRCMVLRGGSMVALERLDLKACHDLQTRTHYINNFMFLPV